MHRFEKSSVCADTCVKREVQSKVQPSFGPSDLSQKDTKAAQNPLLALAGFPNSWLDIKQSTLANCNLPNHYMAI